MEKTHKDGSFDLEILTWVTIFIFSLCVTNYYTFGSLRQHTFIIAQLCQKSGVAWLDSLCSFSQGSNQGVRKAGLLSEWSRELIYFQAHPGCWLNSVPWGCWTQVPVSLLIVSQGPLCFWSCLHFFLIWLDYLPS